MNQHSTQSATAASIRHTDDGVAHRVLPLAPEGIPIIVGFLLSAAALTAASAWFVGAAAAWPVGVVTALLCAWCVWFFRDPDRVAPTDERVVVSPADGVVVGLDPAAPPEELGLEDWDNAGRRISVFMNVFNVHVNRAPAPGVVERTAYRPGRFFNASLDKASEHNERCSLVLRCGAVRLVVVQIAGLVARRIVCRVAEGAALARGERFGLIRFGSRVDVYLPPGASPSVRIGQRVIAGETVIATLATTAREGS